LRGCSPSAADEIVAGKIAINKAKMMCRVMR
jgi:hypothetical protein